MFLGVGWCQCSFDLIRFYGCLCAGVIMVVFVVVVMVIVLSVMMLGAVEQTLGGTEDERVQRAYANFRHVQELLQREAERNPEISVLRMDEAQLCLNPDEDLLDRMHGVLLEKMRQAFPE